ncbi:uncharacterized protein LOC128553887 [Mercenaria mercenaria]|uniref:uncharacterized protein LOC128553887 n=1 Tax=Mercenaria mercenaria TaxID=6596 RepID=UPI00234EB483|nr:uncharacterized protein LOC128553887 [Mercenaria mercenaria]
MELEDQNRRINQIKQEHTDTTEGQRKTIQTQGETIRELTSHNGCQQAKGTQSLDYSSAGQYGNISYNKNENKLRVERVNDLTVDIIECAGTNVNIVRGVVGNINGGGCASLTIGG